MEIKKRILCVDDEPQNLELLKAILEPRGYEIIQASNGIEALARVADSRVNLVLLDVMMPEMNGFDVCVKIKENEKYRTIPVVLITALSSKKDRIRGIEAGADDFITKPIDREEVLARVRMLVKMRELDEELQMSYNRIAAVTELGSMLMKDFRPALFDMNRWIDRIVEANLRGLTGDMGAPEAIFIGVLSHEGVWSWQLNLARNGLLESIPVRLGADMARLSIEGPPFVIAKGPNDDSRYPLIARTIAPHGLTLFNMVIHSSDSFCLVMCNYRKEISRYDTMLVSHLATQCLFMREISEQTRKIESAFAYTVGALARAAEANDEDTGNHIIRVGEYAAVLARRLGMADDFCNEMLLQAQLHDVGKVHIPPEILKKPGKLTDEEFNIMKSHPLFGARIIGGHENLAVGATVALSHHERYDGSGYPRRLKGEAIPIEGRIITIADQYDALRTMRVYKPAFDHDTAYRIISEGDGRTIPAHFDPMVLSSFRQIAGEFEDIYGRLAD